MLSAVKSGGSSAHSPAARLSCYLEFMPAVLSPTACQPHCCLPASLSSYSANRHQGMCHHTTTSDGTWQQPRQPLTAPCCSLCPWLRVLCLPIVCFCPVPAQLAPILPLARTPRPNRCSPSGPIAPLCAPSRVTPRRLRCASFRLCVVVVAGSPAPLQGQCAPCTHTEPHTPAELSLCRNCQQCNSRRSDGQCAWQVDVLSAAECSKQFGPAASRACALAAARRAVLARLLRVRLVLVWLCKGRVVRSVCC